MPAEGCGARKVSGVAGHHLFTVVTTAYNCEATLHRVYDSLCAQTLRDFEWVVVDDGSSDNTGPRMEAWRRSAAFPIRYAHQENAGKHVAMNRAVEMARGELVVVLDGDDACVPTALERFEFHWRSIPKGERGGYTGVAGLCVDQHGEMVGDRFPRDVLDSNSLELRYRYKVDGEKWGCNRADVLRRFPFPEDEQRTYLPEGIIWNRIARNYQTRFINEALRVYWIEGKSLVHGRSPADNATGGRLEHLNALNCELDWFWYAPSRFLRAALHYARFSFHTGHNIAAQRRSLKRGPARLLWMLALAPGYLLYTLDYK